MIVNGALASEDQGAQYPAFVENTDFAVQLVTMGLLSQSYALPSVQTYPHQYVSGEQKVTPAVVFAYASTAQASAKNAKETVKKIFFILQRVKRISSVAEFSYLSHERQRDHEKNGKSSLRHENVIQVLFGEACRISLRDLDQKAVPQLLVVGIHEKNNSRARKVYEIALHRVIAA